MNNQFKNLQNAYFTLADLKPGNSAEVRDAVTKSSFVTLTYYSAPHIHILPLEIGLSLYGRKMNIENKRPMEISRNLQSKGFENIAISDMRSMKHINLEDLANGSWKGYASYHQNPFGIILPVRYDFSRIKP